MNFNVLEGKILVGIDVIDQKYVIFSTSDNEEYILFHDKTCCEKKYKVSILYDYHRLLNQKIVLAEETPTKVTKRIRRSKLDAVDHAEKHPFISYTLGIEDSRYNVVIRMFGDGIHDFMSEKVFFERIR